MYDYYCLGCGAHMGATDAYEAPIPPVDDDDAWEALAHAHDPDCRWIDTRGLQRRPDQGWDSHRDLG
jgi:hypothetical protein